MNNFHEDEDGNMFQYLVFTVEKVGVIKNNPGCWDGIELAVMQQDSKDGPKKSLGSYKRNYATNYNNFAVCQKFDRYFALYSPDYTSTRVMEITPDVGWKDIGGEDGNSNEFCPTEFYIPQVTDMVFEDTAHPADKEIKDWNDKLAGYPAGARYVSLGHHVKAQKIRYEDGEFVRAHRPYKVPTGKYEPDYDWVWGPKQTWEYGNIIFPPDFGFVSGCYWGDDCSWKIQHLDLSKIEDGIIKRSDRFGYIELSPNLSLKQSIETIGCHQATGIGGRTIGINVELQFDLDTGNCYIQDETLYKKIVDGFAHSDNYMDREGWKQKWKERDADLKKRWEERHQEFEHLLENKSY